MSDSSALPQSEKKLQRFVSLPSAEIHSEKASLFPIHP